LVGPAGPEARAQQAAWIHHGAILAAEGVGIGDAVLEFPAPVEDMLRYVAAAPGDARRFQVGERAADAVDDARDDELAVVQGGVLVGDRRNAGMRVRAGEHQVRGGNARGGFDLLLCLIPHFPPQ
jgi:hypothetical protein